MDRATIAPGSSTAVFVSTSQSTKGIWAMDLDDEEPELLLDAVDVRWPTISPDGTRVIVKVIGTPAQSGSFVEVEVTD